MFTKRFNVYVPYFYWRNHWIRVDFAETNDDTIQIRGYYFMILVKIDTTRIDTRLITPPESPEATFRRHRHESCEGRTKAAPASIYLPVRSRGDLAAERTSDATIKFRAHPRCPVRILAWEHPPPPPGIFFLMRGRMIFYC